MKRGVEMRPSRWKTVLLTLGAVAIIFFIIIPLTFSLINPSQWGNVALIPIDAPITTTGENMLASGTVSSTDIVQFIQDADTNSRIKAIVLEINSPGGTAVASDEVATAVKKAQKPVIALIREAGASGAYWIASASDYLVANRMSITGSIGVISSYLEFSGLMDDYGVKYQRLVAGKHKDIGTPLKPLDSQEEKILQSKLNQIHEFFIQEVAANRHLEESKVRELATGEFFLGVEALEHGLVDELGDRETVENYLKEKYSLEEIEYVTYHREPSLLDLLSEVFSTFSFHLGQGMSSVLLKHDSNVLLI